MTERLHLSPKHRAVIEALLSEHLPGVEVWAYGSRVDGRSHDGSDLALVLRGPGLQEIPVGQVADFEEAVGDSSIPFLVEARDWAWLPERYQREIERGYVVLVEGGPEQPERRQSAGSDSWRETVLGDLIDITHGFAFKGHFISDEPQEDVLLTPGNFAIGGGFKADKFKYYSGKVPGDFVLSEGDLIVSMTDLSKQSDTLGYPAFVPECREGKRYLHNQRLGKVLLKDTDVDARYIYYVMCGAVYRHEVLASATGTTVKHTSPGRIKQFRFRLPPLPKQRAIARILGTLDDKIELNRRTNETLEGMARALFKSWFVDFDPVRAKAALRGGRDWSMERARAYLDRMAPEIAALFPDRFVDSELGEIPAGWGAATLDDIALLNPESWTAQNAPEIAVYVDLSNTKWGVIEKYETYAWQDAPSRAKRVLRIGDTILGTVRPGNRSYAFIGVDGLTGSTGFAVLRPRQLRDQALVWCCATASENVDRLTHLADGAAYPAVRPQVVGAAKITLPSGIIRDAFGTICGPLLDRMETNKRESRALAAQRNALLPKLVSGELRVPVEGA